MTLARLDPWRTVHRQAVAEMLTHLLQREGSTYALRRAVALRTHALPLYGDMGGFLVLDANGGLQVAAHEAEQQLAMDRWVVDKQDELYSWLGFAWAESKGLLPLEFQELALIHIAGPSDSALQ